MASVGVLAVAMAGVVGEQVILGYSSCSTSQWAGQWVGLTVLRVLVY